MKLTALVIAIAGIGVATVAASPAAPTAPASTGGNHRFDISDPGAFNSSEGVVDPDHHVVVFKKRSYWCQLPGGLNDELWGRAAQNDELSKRFAKLRFCICSSPGVAGYDPNHDKTDCQPESEIKEFIKLAEGGFNRVFQITMKDGSEVLARLPYPSTKPDRFTLASEVATLDLARVNNVQVPKVLHYCIDADNPVGAEFVIMEKVPGRSIGNMWFNLSEDQRLKIISEVVRTEVKLSKIELPAYGSIYYEKDPPADIHRTRIIPTSNIKGLCIGPHVSLRWWYKERGSINIDRGSINIDRGSINIDRGPHSSPLQVLSRVADKELAWLKAFGRPRLPFERAYRECMNYRESRPKEHVKSLENYLKIAPYLVPHETRFHRPILRHPDLQPNNIFVSDDLDIVGIIDWQHCSVLPQFLAAGIPNHFQNNQDEESLRFIPPKLPDTLTEMEDEERARVLEPFRRRHLHFFYLAFTQRLNPAHFEVLDRRMDLLTRKVFDHASEPWEGNNIPLKADLIHITRVWEELVLGNGYMGKDIPLCPIAFAEADVQHTLNTLQQQEDTDTQLEQAQNVIGVSTDGWTPNDVCEGAVEQARDIKTQGINSLDTEEEKMMTLKHWPFDDFDEE
ncbi:hypothetical protein DV737_g5059, partial [Chaetothyriales sp. CBS 132003]